MRLVAALTGDGGKEGCVGEVGDDEGRQAAGDHVQRVGTTAAGDDDGLGPHGLGKGGAAGFGQAVGEGGDTVLVGHAGEVDAQLALDSGGAGGDDEDLLVLVK